MSYLGLLSAVRARLEGKPFKYTPKLQDITVRWDEENGRTTLPISAAEVLSELRDPCSVSVGARKVPIYFFDIIGHDEEQVYPALTFEIVDLEPRFDEGSILSLPEYGGLQMHREAISSTSEEVFDGTTSLGEAPRMRESRALEVPYDFIVELRAYAKDPIFSAFLVAYITQRFLPRHFIRVPLNNGCYGSWDLMYESFQDLDKREAARSGTPGFEREYAKVWQYRAEGFLDNTDTAVLENLVRSRTITMDNLGA